MNEFMSSHVGEVRVQLTEGRTEFEVSLWSQVHDSEMSKQIRTRENPLGQTHREYNSQYPKEYLSNWGEKVIIVCKVISGRRGNQSL